MEKFGGMYVNKYHVENRSRVKEWGEMDREVYLYPGNLGPQLDSIAAASFSFHSASCRRRIRLHSQANFDESNGSSLSLSDLRRWQHGSHLSTKPLHSHFQHPTSFHEVAATLCTPRVCSKQFSPPCQKTWTKRQTPAAQSQNL